MIGFAERLLRLAPRDMARDDVTSQVQRRQLHRTKDCTKVGTGATGGLHLASRLQSGVEPPHSVRAPVTIHTLLGSAATAIARKCWGRRAVWLTEPQAELLPVPCFHVVLTRPQQLPRSPFSTRRACLSSFPAAGCPSTARAGFPSAWSFYFATGAVPALRRAVPHISPRRERAGKLSLRPSCCRPAQSPNPWCLG